MTTQVALLAEEQAGLLRTSAPPFLIPLDVEVLAEDKVRLSEGGTLPSGVHFDPLTGGLSIPVGYYEIAFTIVTTGASFKQPAIGFEVSKDTYIGLAPTSSTTASILTENGLTLGSKEQLHDYTLLVTNAQGVGEAHDPVILFEPPG
jgi:hypothetical protein